MVLFQNYTSAGRRSSLSNVLLDSALPAFSQSDSLDEYRVRIPNFEGPLDLLLHLIRKDQINIYDIPIARICQNYLEHLELMRHFDVNLAGEFMVMAATLLHLKSQVLLPEEEDKEKQNDPRLSLVAQLLEYERFKEAGEEIDKKSWLFRDVFPRPPAATKDLLPEETFMDAPVEPIDNFQLLICLKIALDRTTRKPIKIAAAGISLKDAVRTIGILFNGRECIDFSILISMMHKRSDIVVNFLAILELARLRFLEILQQETFGPIQLKIVRSLEELDMGLLDPF